MRISKASTTLLFFTCAVFASPYREDLVEYNLNVNKHAASPLDYTSSWPGGSHHTSPSNWRALPVYTLLLDKFANGNPSNDDFFGTIFESDYRETQLRYGGDLKGLVSRLDYLQGMGVRVIFISGTPFLNMIWQADIPGCFESDFDQYGDMDAFGVHPDWQRQLAKFSSVQDRLRDWKPSVMEKLIHFSCMAIEALDFDAIRVDKATQMTVDGLASWSSGTRRCASGLGKTNFLITGEVTGGDAFGGRGRTAMLRPPDLSAAASVTTSDNYFLRDPGIGGLDGVAFHYSIYRTLLRFLGVDGDLLAEQDLDTTFVKAWEQMFVNNDLLNPNTGLVDPRHMFGISNFDVFRWPGLQDGTRKGMLGSFITSLVLPGVPLLYYGEEQDLYVFDNGATNYLYGRQAMTGNQAWKRHGCYTLGSASYYDMPFDKSTLGCHDDWNALDHFDPTAASRRIFRRFHQLRTVYGALQDGFSLTERGNWTHRIQLPYSIYVETELGLWSVSRAGIHGAQTLSGTHNDDVWLLYSNENTAQTYSYDCHSALGIISPYTSDTVVRDLFAPYETYSLSASSLPYNNGSGAPWFGCLPNVTMDKFGFKALVPVAQWTSPIPSLTRFVPGHDHRILVSASDINATIVEISIEFDVAMDCDSVTQSISFNMSSSSIDGPPTATNVRCATVLNLDHSEPQGRAKSAWIWSATLRDFPDGVLTINVDNPFTLDSNSTTKTVDHLLLRKGSVDNVMVFPENDYDTSGESFQMTNDGQYIFHHKAYGAEKFRYSGSFGRNWTDWLVWEDATIMDDNLFSAVDNFWDGDHVMVQYWSEATLSVAHVVHADVGYFGAPRRVPQFLARGPFNSWGYDRGVKSLMIQNSNGLWELEISASWPTYVQLNVWSFDHYYYGDADGDGVLDRLPPNTMAANFLNMSAPPSPYLAWSLLVDDSTMTWTLEPRGQSHAGAVLYALLLCLPLATGALAVVIFVWTFYGIKHNQYGNPAKPQNRLPIIRASNIDSERPKTQCQLNDRPLARRARQVLIATLEYEIFDWDIKVRIGGLGVMSSLMGTAMSDAHLTWVVPKVGDIEYPVGEPADPIEVIVFGQTYFVEVETHVVDNVTYVILDSSVFRGQTRSNPYPARMDDLSSAIFYSTWNQAIAATIRRFPTIDIYHINDYHGALAGIYLLPRVIPVCLSLHNAEFQGLWPLRTAEEMKEVCSAFNISKENCTKYVQYGNTFNLLHAAASFISIHQNSLGVAGVSDKYGKRSLARYPALWILKDIDSLPNPDPDDIAPVNTASLSISDVEVDPIAEAARSEHKRQTQEWAGLEQNPASQVLVFVGRFSKQKGIDLIADVMPSMYDTSCLFHPPQTYLLLLFSLEKHINIQLITVGPVVDLHGRFAAEKLSRLMNLYPGQVFSKPEFTYVPPCVFNGTDFALIPSRDEPFGLVAVEFGRRGALGIGSRVGGLGSMPGWWYPIESNSTSHLLAQFSKTIKMALKSSEEERAVLRARSAVQRFPVIEWCQRIEDFHRRSIAVSREGAGINAWARSDSHNGSATSTQSFDNNITLEAGLTIPQSICTQPPLTVETSISSLIEAKANSPLARAMASFTDADGDVTSEFVQKLETLSTKNSKGELSIGKYLIKSEEEFFRTVKKQKLSSASSILSSPFESAPGTPLSSVFSPLNIASAAGFLFFGLNFGEEAGAASDVWTLRACVVQGSQQLWVAALWYWGYTLNDMIDDYLQPWWTVLIVWPLSILSLILAYIMLHGLPEYYHQRPPKIPHFLQTLLRRKLVLWFFASEILRDYWLSGPYGRNWSYLWSVDIPKWQTLLLVIIFFVFIWAGVLLVLMHFSKTHTWLLPVFAVGLGAPRWCQIFWGTSSIALYVPWAGNAGPYLGLSLWLWLGIMDAVQSLGLGMMLLQMIGAICIMIARASAPDRLGPTTVFPDAAKWDFSDGLAGSINMQ
ncbi:hypothetical protein H0H87_007521 [Tephrocybe sp. NHM501043]|nr:hypothetical protein H0H87_007521 [Tephrocybe sp. NHM501043]